MIVDLISLFPDYFSSPMETGVLRKARQSGVVEFRLTDLREYGEGKHLRVDDRPYGGGPGMVLSPGPICKAIRAVKKEESHVIYLSPQGIKLSASRCQQLSSFPHLVLLCGHYEGVDERVLKEVDEEISIGDFVLSNGCLAALVLIDGVIRFIPSVLGNQSSALSDSFVPDLFQKREMKMFDAPVYTRPPIFEGVEVPQVLCRGNHSEIEKWRYSQAFEKTKKVRPELLHTEGVEK